MMHNAAVIQEQSVALDKNAKEAIYCGRSNSNQSIVHRDRSLHGVICSTFPYTFKNYLATGIPVGGETFPSLLFHFPHPYRSHLEHQYNICIYRGWESSGWRPLYSNYRTYKLVLGETSHDAHDHSDTCDCCFLGCAIGVSLFVFVFVVLVSV